MAQVRTIAVEAKPETTYDIPVKVNSLQLRVDVLERKEHEAVRSCKN